MSDRLEDARQALRQARQESAAQTAASDVPLWDEKPTAAAMEHAPEVWRETVVATVDRIAREREMFTADDVWSELAKSGDRGTLVYERRALGPILLECARRGLIAATSEYAGRNGGTAAPIRVWRSRSAAA